MRKIGIIIIIFSGYKTRGLGHFQDNFSFLLAQNSLLSLYFSQSLSPTQHHHLHHSLVLKHLLYFLHHHRLFSSSRGHQPSPFCTSLFFEGSALLHLHPLAKRRHHQLHLFVVRCCSLLLVSFSKSPFSFLPPRVSSDLLALFLLVSAC